MRNYLSIETESICAVHVTHSIIIHMNVAVADVIIIILDTVRMVENYEEAILKAIMDVSLRS